MSGVWMTTHRWPRCRGPWICFAHDGFAGPRTEWRGVSLVDGATYECGEPGDVAPGAIMVDDEHGARLPFVRSAAGVTLAELLDETIEQRARLDGNVGVHVLCALAAQVLSGDVGGVSAEQVLIGFDGSIWWRGLLRWWGPRGHARVPLGYRTTTPHGETLRLFGELAAEVLSSRRFSARDPALPLANLDAALRKPARSFLRKLLEDTIAADASAARVTLPADGEVVRDLERLRQLCEPIAAADLGALVTNLFPDRWTQEREAQQFIEQELAEA